MRPQSESSVIYEQDFPFLEYRQDSGDYFTSINDAMLKGFLQDQIWSVVESGESDHCYIYGPPHHWVNLIGYVATKEKHDDNTYYIEHWSDLCDEPTEQEEWASYDPDC
jgi:NAD(P)H-flavin reductase